MNSIKPVISLHYVQVCYDCELLDFILALMRRHQPLFPLPLHRVGFKYSLYVAASAVFWLCLGSVCFKPQLS